MADSLPLGNAHCDSHSENVERMGQRLLWVRITESENVDKMKLETEIWVYQKWDGIIVCSMAGEGGGM
jgi:hypothetical protein